MEKLQDHFTNAFKLHQSGRISEAVNAYLEILPHQQENAQLLYLLGTAYLQTGRLQDGIIQVQRSLALHPENPDALNNLGNALKDLHRLDDALASYDKALALRPGFAEAYHNRGLVLKEMRRLDDALASYDQAIEIFPDYVEAYNNRGNLLKELQRLEEAIASYDKALSVRPDYAEAYNNRGLVLKDLKRFDEALASHDMALKVRPNYADAYNNRGVALQEIHRFDEALASYDMAVAIRPDNVEAYNNRGAVLKDLKRFEEALASYDKVVAIRPDFVEAYNNRGVTLHDLKRHDEALVSFGQALSIRPDYALAYYNRGNALKSLKRMDEALADYQSALSLRPDIKFLRGDALHVKMFLCDWNNFEDDLDILKNEIQRGQKVSTPFVVHGLLDSPALQKQCAETYVRTQFPDAKISLSRGLHTRSERIRIGYFSSDFCNHPVTHLLAQLFEIHDRSRFEIFAYSLDSRENDPWRNRVVHGVDHFIEVGQKSDSDIAALARSVHLDIAVDLNGLTSGARTGVFAHRAAPVQVHYIGFLGTMGAPYFDYMLADPVLIPKEQQNFYTEKIAYLPCYQCNDNTVDIQSKAFTRSEFNLPEGSFIFCSFNNNSKITPSVFSSWMRILDQTPGSVLWIYVENETAKSNLVREAKRCGVDPQRLIFAEKIPLRDHLARQRLADLFLDTYPYNAGATASNALRVGLPVITRIGESFASRYGASLLSAVGLAELVANSPEHYESLAIDLATQPDRLAILKKNLAENLATCPLFDTAGFTRSIESAFIRMYQRSKEGLLPAHFFA